MFVVGEVCAQEPTTATDETLTLDHAITLALRYNRGIKIARLAVEKSDDEISAAKTFRLPSLHAYSLVSGNLATNELTVPNPANTLFPGLGPFFSLNVERKPTALFGASVIEPLSQQYRIGLQIKFERVSRDSGTGKAPSGTERDHRQGQEGVLRSPANAEWGNSVQEALKSLPRAGQDHGRLRCPAGRAQS
jgi:hypothetical protein